jgi:predicted transposase/invertase (TIGR01784 family)
MDLLDPRVDFVFKRIFGDEANKDVLLAFLNRIFAEAGEPELTEILLLNPYTDKDAPDDKLSIFDIYARSQDGRLIDIEMQLFNRYDIEKRTLFYWSKRYAAQLKEGHTYNTLQKCVTINLLNYKLLPGAQVHHVFHLRENKSGLCFSDDLEVHVLELPKLDASTAPAGAGLTNWLLFLKNEDQSMWEALRMNEPKLKKAMDTLEYLSQDEQARMVYEARQKYLHDEASRLCATETAMDRGLKEGRKEGLKQGRAEGREEGLKEGLKEGREEGIQEGIEQGLTKGQMEAKQVIARNMLALGLEFSLIVQATGLAEEEIKVLQKNL